MNSLPSARRPNGTWTGAHFTVRPANSLSYSEAWRPLRTTRYQREENEENRDRPGATTESRLHYQSRTCSVVKGQSLESEKSPFKPNQSGKSFEYDQMRNMGRQGRLEWRRSNLSSRSKSLDWRTGAKSPERSKTFSGNIVSRTGDKSADGCRIMYTVSKTQNNPDTSLSNARVQSLPTRYMSASLGPKGGQSILERIEKLYGSVEFGNSEDYKTTEHYKGSFNGTFPRRFSSGEHRRSSGQSGDSLSWTNSKDFSVSNFPGINRIKTSGQWQNQDGSSHVEGATFKSRGFSDIGTQSLDRARSRSTVASKIRAARAAEEMDKPTQFSTFLRGISEVSTPADTGETPKMEDIKRKNWSRTKRNLMKTELQDEDMQYSRGQLGINKETPSDDVFESQQSQLKSFEKYNDKPVRQSAASVRNKINQFEALTQRTQTSSPRRAFSVPEHLSKNYNGVQRSSSAKALGTFRWGGVNEEQAGERGATDIKTYVSAGEKKQEQDKTTTKEIDIKAFYEEEPKLNRLIDKEFQNSKYLRTKQELPAIKDSPPMTNVINIDETDFCKSPMTLRKDSTSSGSEISTPTSSDNDETPTNTPGTSPLMSPTTLPQNTPPLMSNSLDNSPSLTGNLPDLVSKDNLNGKKRVLDLNAWLDGLNPQIKAWEYNGEEDDDSTQKDDDSNYDSDSGESSVTVTSVMSNKSFSVSLADLCNFAGVESDSENDSDEWQLTGRRSASLSSDISGFSYVSVMPTEELDKLIQDVKSIGDNNLQDYEDVHVVVLHKEIGVGLGFSLAGGVDQNKPVTVHKVFHSGVAAQEGSVKEGDQVLSINGSALSSCAHWEALRVLRRAKGREMGVVVLKKPDVRALSNGNASAVIQGPAPSLVNETGQRITVNLEKSDRDLGFSLEGGVDSSLGNKPLTVQKIFQGGPVEKVLPGDEVLEVNGVNVEGMRRLEAWTLIRKLPPGPVNVILQRNPRPHKT